MISCKIIVSSNSDLTSKDFAKVTFFCESPQHNVNPLQSLETNDCSGHLVFTLWIPYDTTWESILFFTQPQAEEGADAPFDVVQCKALLVAIVGEIEYHRHAEISISPLANDGSTTCDDDLGKMIVQGYAVVAEGHRCVAIDDEGGKGGDMQ